MFTLCWAEFPRVSLTASSRGILLPKMVPTSVTASFASGEASATSEWSKAVSDVGSTSETGRQHKMGVGEGAAGVDMGRNVFQSINPSAMLHALSLVVHENYTGERAYEVFCESAVLPKT